MAVDRAEGSATERGRSLTRRQFLGAAAVGTGGLLLSAAGVDRAWGSASSAPAGTSSVLPPPEAAGIDHVVVLTMENRSFDHFLSWLPGADGRHRGAGA